MQRLKKSTSITISPYIERKLKKYVGEGKPFSSNSDAISTALIEMFSRMEKGR